MQTSFMFTTSPVVSLVPVDCRVANIPMTPPVEEEFDVRPESLTTFGNEGSYEGHFGAEEGEEIVVVSSFIATAKGMAKVHEKVLRGNSQVNFVTRKTKAAKKVVARTVFKAKKAAEAGAARGMDMAKRAITIHQATHDFIGTAFSTGVAVAHDKEKAKARYEARKARKTAFVDLTPEEVGRSVKALADRLCGVPTPVVRKDFGVLATERTAMAPGNEWRLILASVNEREVDFRKAKDGYEKMLALKKRRRFEAELEKGRVRLLDRARTIVAARWAQDDLRAVNALRLQKEREKNAVSVWNEEYGKSDLLIVQGVLRG